MEPKGTPNGETAPIEPVKNDAQQTVTPQPNTDEIEALRKKAEQAEMRARQLENQAKEREKKDEEARQKQLEEQNEFKTLYEREKEAREKLEAEMQDEEIKKAVQSAKANVFKDYPIEVVELAEATGIELYDDSEESVKSLKNKLDVISSKIKPADKSVKGNNIRPTELPADDKKTLYGRMRYDDKQLSRSARRAAISQLPELAEMRGISQSQE